MLALVDTAHMFICTRALFATSCPSRFSDALAVYDPLPRAAPACSNARALLLPRATISPA